jgi:hypothetical protein
MARCEAMLTQYVNSAEGATSKMGLGNMERNPLRGGVRCSIATRHKRLCAILISRMKNEERDIERASVAIKRERREKSLLNLARSLWLKNSKLKNSKSKLRFWL